MKKNTSSKFFVGSLVVFVVLYAVVQFVLSNMLALGENVTPPPSMDDDAITERIAPVAQERVGEEPIVVAAAPAESDAAAGGESGPGMDVYNSVCMACHAAGVLEAPKLGSADDWAPRIEKGIDTLYDHAINGFNMMPAKGGNGALSDDDVKAAVDYMVAESQ
ncbi:Cytochrome c5 [Methylophaga frappieri]|uniref:Cytochrome c5 n=1 Tax=Methylophaga frappieri (strain ATCC BAA-2434 / DSM 25690 / JAM7) TaxID=754477 RepID=I1YH74_METFJ|nr:cytochrome c5 family protein [Methylophaga frappieri]AFJ02267.1 Cytochrome c5 [Methylophaga frappieri]